jgi:hypothetical protein
MVGGFIVMEFKIFRGADESTRIFIPRNREAACEALTRGRGASILKHFGHEEDLIVVDYKYTHYLI